eukprot:2528014-Prorocentrum_lima.AAC.1
MTSSLVGSKMCIRDSANEMDHHMVMIRRLMAMAGSEASFVYQRHSTPVSYTHLTLPTICSV